MRPDRIHAVYAARPVRRTDYSKIAAYYDDNPDRHRIDADLQLRALLAERRPLVALDLGCGTGNYIATQTRIFGGDVAWHGIDPSEDMLVRARSKLVGVPLAVGRAESLPYSDGSFDYVATNFAFHHFEDKGQGLDEIRRVSKPGARLRIANIDPPRMRGWWGYTFFPLARQEDEKRFWSTELIAYELGKRGYHVHVHVDYDASLAPIAGILADAERRDISQLNLLEEDEYMRGLTALRQRHAHDPMALVQTEIALLTLCATLMPR